MKLKKDDFGLNIDRTASKVEKMDSGRHFTLGMIYPNRLF